MSADAPKPVLELLPSYVAAIENSVGTNLFRNLYYRIDGKVIDVLDDGDLSCAVFVSSILDMFKLISARHATVKSTIADMQRSGWVEIEEPLKGAVILWDFEKNGSGAQGTNRHIGFYIDETTAISNSSSKRTVVKHPPSIANTHDRESERDILAYYWHPKLG